MRLLRLILVLAFLILPLGIMISCYASDRIVDADSYVYELNDDGDAVIVDNYILGGHMTPFYQAIIPAEIDGHKVVAIGDYAFEGAWIDKLVIPDTVKHIGDMAFANLMWLEEVHIPSSVESMGVNPFFASDIARITVDEENLCFEVYENMLCWESTGILVSVINGGTKSIEIPECVSVIGSYTFCDHAFDYVGIADSVVEICEHAFDFAQIGTIEIGKNLSVISEDTFVDMRGVSHISVNEENEHLTAKDGALYTKNMERLILYFGNDEELVLSESITDISASAFYDSDLLKRIVIPFSVKSIGDSAFKGCGNLEEIVFSDGLEVLGGWLIDGCHSLKEICIPSTVKSIGDDAFDYAELLSAINVSEENSAYKSVDGILYTKDGKRLIRSPMGKKGSITVLSGTEIIGENAFKYSSATEIELPRGLLEIEDAAFYQSDFREITVPDSVHTIGDFAFSTDRLFVVRIGRGVRYIGEFAFDMGYLFHKIEFSDTDGWKAWVEQDGEYYNIPSFIFKNGYVAHYFLGYKHYYPIIKEK
ncbi:MAG: hypothetical protein E7617_06600 [Ruminococcaceae bacterium]|nr:hypothetical protein [Oscillospiraceae bacterium]